MPAAPADPALSRAVRDCLAGQFALAIESELPAVIEVLEHQLATNANREKWRPVHDAAEVVRALKPHLRERLAEAVRVRIDAKLTPGADDFSKTARFSAATLSLVSEEEVQEEIAIGNTTRRLREAAGDEFFALNTRLAAVLGTGEIPDERSPAYARVFARALLDVIASLASDTPARLAAFTAFDPAMLQALAAAYRDANALLAARGVLPGFRRSYGAPQQVPGVHVVSHGLAPSPPPEVAAGAQAKPAPPKAPAAAPGAPAPVPAPPKATVFDRLLANAAVPQALVTELVAAIFARLAADPHLTPAAREQIARLEPGVLEAALADRRIFTDPGHPARGLIDAMAELGAAGGTHHHVEGRLPEEWIAGEVRMLTAGRLFDAPAFAAARDRMARLAQLHHDVLVEDDALIRLVRREEEARAALQDSALELAHRIANADVTEAAGAFVYVTWRPVLIRTHRTHGYGSPAWLADLATLDDLLWTLAPRATAEERERLAALLPTVRDRLRQGLVHAGAPVAEIEARLAELDRMHEALRRAPAATALSTTAGLGRGIADDVTATLHMSSGELADERLARGAWFEFTEDDGTHLRARLSWLSPVQGACVFKEPARNRSFAISLADLRARRDAGRARPVDGPGIALACIEAVLAEAARRLGIDPGAVNAG
jgi:hypothetical protein